MGDIGSGEVMIVIGLLLITMSATGFYALRANETFKGATT